MSVFGNNLKLLCLKKNNCGSKRFRQKLRIKLLPTLGIHHHNRYNAYCLADDIMEPYRPYVDRLVFQMSGRYDMSKVELTKSQKAELLSIPTFDVQISGKRSPLMIAVGQSSNWNSSRNNKSHLRVGFIVLKQPFFIFLIEPLTCLYSENNI